MAEGGKKADVVTAGSATFYSDYTLVLLQKQLQRLREGLELGFYQAAQSKKSLQVLRALHSFSLR
jgi:hypothetical protein